MNVKLNPNEKKKLRCSGVRMNQKIKSILLPPYRMFRKVQKLLHIRKETARLSQIPVDSARPKIFYFGVTEHSNLGDMAQCYCIRKWLSENYSECPVYEFESSTVVCPHFSFVNKLQKVLSSDDMIFFQSGYTTQDLGGDHELMHRIIIDAFPSAKVIMMPQTIYFKSPENKAVTSKSYNQNRNLIFLARDRVSYKMACEMFPDVTVRQFPDIVTSLIGHYSFSYNRDKILFCCRNDTEKYYSDDELENLRQNLSRVLPTERTDTTIRVEYKQLRKNIQFYLEEQVNSLARYKLVITDRYHGTIFSLAANTPVIVLKTNDHKVTTGAEWFKGIYDDYVYVAQSLEHARELAEMILQKEYSYRVKPYFDLEYYSKLKGIIEEKYEKVLN